MTHEIRSWNSRFLKSKLALAMHMLIFGDALAAPAGGDIVGGAGSVTQRGAETTIIQDSERLAIDWQSFDVGENERVEFIQPGESAVALNRILGDKGSEILGRIDANGHVILVNPRGVIFGQGAVVNAGGLIASGLQINPGDFMNGDLVFKRIEGTEGTVINSGLINAASGGNVALIGTRVENRGLISANLGSVILASGAEAVLTFDDSGLLGVQIDKAVLQEELDSAAIQNSGDIHAENGRILLSASKTRDVFSQAVNWGDEKQARSVTYDEDGGFTLSAAGDVINSGLISTSGESGGGKIAILGENVTHSGAIKADAGQGRGGNVELSSNTTTKVIGGGSVTTNAEQGGDIKLLGKNVGLFDQSSVSATGENGGGRVLLGGDQEGLNPQVRNADFAYIDAQSHIDVSATHSGNGGTAIVFAEDTARVYGRLSSKGGATRGDGGFIETSGKHGFSINSAPDISAANGRWGHWLIDPNDITVTSQGDSLDENGEFESQSDSMVSVDAITTVLSGGGNVTLTTGGSGGNIIVNNEIRVNPAENSTGNPTLTLNAGQDIEFNADIEAVGDKPLNIHLHASRSGDEGDIRFTGTRLINTNGGDFKIAQIADDIVNENAPGASNIDLSNVTINVGSGDFVAHAADKLTLGQDLNLDGGDLVLGAADWEFGKSGSPGVASISAGEGDITFITGGNLRLPNIQSAGDINLNVRDAKEDDQLKLHNARQIGGGWRQFALSGTLTLGLGSQGTVEIHEIQKIGENGELKLVVTSDEMDQDQMGPRVDLQTSQSAVLGKIDVRGGFSLEADGTIKQEQGGESLNIVGESKFSSRDLDLNNSENFFGDTIFIGGSANTVVLKAKGDLTLSDSTGERQFGSLDVESLGGHIEQEGALRISGETILSAGQITLNISGNDFNKISIKKAESAEIVDLDDLYLDDVTVVGELDLTVANNLMQTGALDLGALELNVDGNTTLSRGDNLIGVLSGNVKTGQINIKGPLELGNFKVKSTSPAELFNLSLSGDKSSLSQVDGTTLIMESDVRISANNVEINSNVRLLNHADLAINDINTFIFSGDAQGRSDDANSVNVNGVGEDGEYSIMANASWQGIAFHINGGGEGILKGPASENTWSIQTDGIHQLSTGGRQLSFEGMHKLKGGNEIDTLDYSEFSDGADIKLWALPEISSIEDIEVVKGNSNQVLVAPANTSNTWTIGNGRNTIETVEKTTVEKANGDVVELVEVLIKRDIEFQGFTNLKGGDSVDNFIVQLDGQDSDDPALNYQLYGGHGKDENSLEIKDSLQVTGGADNWAGTYGVSQNGDPEFSFSFSGKEHMKVGYREIEGVSLNSHLDQMEVKGRVGQNDSIRLSAEWWRFNDFEEVKYDGGLQSLVIEGGISDSISLVHNKVGDTGTVTDPNGAVTPPPPPKAIQLPQSLTLKGGTLSFDEGIQLETKSLRLIDLQNGIGTEASPLTISVDALELTDNTGEIYIRELNGMRLDGLSGGGLIDLEVSAGDLNQSGAITKSSGSLQLSAPLGNIVLENDANKIGVAVNLKAGGLAAVYTQGDLALSGVAAGDLNLRASGGIESDAAVVVSNETRLVSGGDIRLDNRSNDFGRVSIAPINDGAVEDVDLADNNAVTFGDVNISGELSIVANEIHFSGIVSAGALTTRVAKDVWVWKPMIIKHDVRFYDSPEVRGLPLIHTENGQIYGARTLTAGDQMIEIETLAEIDPAIFTNVKNYFYQDISVLLPSDQRYEDSSEEEKLSGLAQ